MANKPSRRHIPAGLAYIADNIQAGDNILGLPKADKAAWAKGIDFSRDNSTIFFAGCGYQYSAALEPLVAALLQADRVSMDPDLPVKVGGISMRLGFNAANVFSKVASRDAAGDSFVLRDAVRVLKALGMDIAYLGEDEPCCGAPLYHTGLRNEFAARAAWIHSRLKSMGVKKIIGMVPSCTYAVRDLFPKAAPGFDIEVKHFIEAVAENIGQGKL